MSTLKDEAYPESEDSYLLLDALKDDSDRISALLGAGGLILEIGCGSGVVSKHCADLFPSAQIYGCDVNPTAISATCQTMHSHASGSEVLYSDLFTAFAPRGCFDVVIFNPPYVPTDADEYGKSLRLRDISASWAGGRDGREVTDRFLRTVGAHLVPDGVVYLVVIDLNDVPSTLAYASRYGLEGEIFRERKAGIEKLYVLRFYRIESLCGKDKPEDLH